MKRTAVVLLTILYCAVSHAREFNLELAGTLSGEDFDHAFNADVFTIDARYYFHAVSDKDGPYREAAFINPASSIAVSYGSAELDEADSISESDDWQLQGRYFNRAHGWYISAGFGQGESDTREGPQVPNQAVDVLGGSIVPLQQALIVLETDADSKNYSLGLGRYFGSRTTLDLSYTRNEIDADTRLTSCFDVLPLNFFSQPLDGLLCSPSPFITQAETETDHWQVAVKHLGDVAHLPLALRGAIGYLKSSTETELRFSGNIPVAEPGIRIALSADDFADLIALDPFPFTGAIAIPQPTSFTDEGWNAAVDVTLFPRKNLGITLAYDYADIEDIQTKTYGATVEWFITHGVAVSLSYTNIDFDNNFGSRDSVALRLSGRF